eukprot:scaffold48637_cov18-Prasinocladus_malaysianus.AAC.1
MTSSSPGRQDGRNIMRRYTTATRRGLRSGLWTPPPSMLDLDWAVRAAATLAIIGTLVGIVKET